MSNANKDIIYLLSMQRRVLDWQPPLDQDEGSAPVVGWAERDVRGSSREETK
jgi:hypothetical protein